MLATRPAAFVGLVCRGKRKEAVTVRRRLTGESQHEFPDLELDATGERCAQLRDVVPSNSLRPGYYRYEVVVLDPAGKTRDEGHRDFAVEPGAPADE
jgi:hypothetical protein